jgi:hypothetical protein
MQGAVQSGHPGPRRSQPHSCGILGKRERTLTKLALVGSLSTTGLGALPHSTSAFGGASGIAESGTETASRRYGTLAADGPPFSFLRLRLGTNKITIVVYKKCGTRPKISSNVSFLEGLHTFVVGWSCRSSTEQKSRLCGGVKSDERHLYFGLGNGGDFDSQRWTNRAWRE